MKKSKQTNTEKALNTQIGLEEKNQKNPEMNKTKLTFDIETNELIFKKNSSEISENETVVDQIYKDGFF